jgi:hypothetical protein
MRQPRYPSLYQINTRVWLTELSRPLGRPATLDDIPDAELDAWAARGFDWVWLLSVWQIGPAGQCVSRANADWRREFGETLPDLCDDDIGGSGFAIRSYTVAASLGGEVALARLRQRLRQRGLRLLLDFVPNHMALDHPWVEQHPDYFVPGTEADRERAPQNYTRRGGRLLAHGRDPYFPGWPDTLQLNYGNPDLQAAMRGELLKIAGQCDGVRCDMAMLLLPEVFERTWGLRAGPFWPEAIAGVRGRHPDFLFVAEVYWDLEWTLQQQGFDYTYDKRLYDRLRAGTARPVREHLLAGLDFQDRLARFLENHDEPRAAVAVPAPVQLAAAVVTFLTPGLRFFHQGQLTGARQRVSPHLVRGPVEPVDAELAKFYDGLLPLLRTEVVRQGRWRLLERRPAWEGNETWDCLIAWAWELDGRPPCLVVVNYAPHPSQGYVHLPVEQLAGKQWRLQDQLGPSSYDRDGDELRAQGLYLDLPGWHYHAFAVYERPL